MAVDLLKEATSNDFMNWLNKLPYWLKKEFFSKQKLISLGQLILTKYYLAIAIA
jgi:hypothetical protein